MRFLLFVYVLSTVFLAVYGALAIFPPDKDHPGHCYSEGTGQMDYGEERTLEDCIRASCDDDGTIQLASCGAIDARCELTPQDPSKPYPECCPKPKSC